MKAEGQMNIVFIKPLFIKLSIAVILSFLLTSCLTISGIPKQITSLNVAGCDEEDVKISNDSVELNGEQNWDAECNGKKYECSYLPESDMGCYEVTE